MIGIDDGEWLRMFLDAGRHADAWSMGTAALAGMGAIRLQASAAAHKAILSLMLFPLGDKEKPADREVTGCHYTGAP
jgi:hypothetical protein